MALVTVITKMQVTTAEVVARPTPSAPPLTWNPLKQPMEAI